MEKTIAMLIDRKKIGRGFSGKTICLVCGNTISICESKIKKGMGKYCSKKCYGEATVGTIRPEISAKISKTKASRGTYAILSCEICGKKMSFSKSHAIGRRTCSRDCAGVLTSQRLKKMWENPPDDLIEKLRTAMTKRRKMGRTNRETKPERIFREELERRKVVFEPQFGFGGIMIADFFIPHLQAFIFVDGSYWHGLPSSINKDWQQVQYARTKGMKAYRFSEEAIFTNVTKCVDDVFEDAGQPFSIADLMDRFIILGIKSQLADGDKLKQATTDYRRMQKVMLSGMEFFNYTNPENIITTMKKLLDVNIKIFMLVDKVQRNDFTKEEAKKIQDLNTYRSELMNALSKEFKDKEIIKL